MKFLYNNETHDTFIPEDLRFISIGSQYAFHFFDKRLYDFVKLPGNSHKNFLGAYCFPKQREVDCKKAMETGESFTQAWLKTESIPIRFSRRIIHSTGTYHTTGIIDNPSHFNTVKIKILTDLNIMICHVKFPMTYPDWIKYFNEKETIMRQYKNPDLIVVISNKNKKTYLDANNHARVIEYASSLPNIHNNPIRVMVTNDKAMFLENEFTTIQAGCTPSHHATSINEAVQIILNSRDSSHLRLIG